MLRDQMKTLNERCKKIQAGMEKLVPRKKGRPPIVDKAYKQYEQSETDNGADKAQKHFSDIPHRCSNRTGATNSQYYADSDNTRYE